MSKANQFSGTPKKRLDLAPCAQDMVQSGERVDVRSLTSFFDAKATSVAINRTGYTPAEQVERLVGMMRGPDDNVALKAMKEFRGVARENAELGNYIVEASEERTRWHGDEKSTNRVAMRKMVERTQGNSYDAGEHADPIVFRPLSEQEEDALAQGGEAGGDAAQGGLPEAREGVDVPGPHGEAHAERGGPDEDDGDARGRGQGDP